MKKIINYGKKLTEWLQDRLESILGGFVTVHTRPKVAAKVQTWSLPVPPKVSFAIVMQGPLVKKNRFSLETVKIYKKNFPNARIIVSTWEDENKKEVELLKDQGAEVMLNIKPALAGVSNINYQIISSYNGIKIAAEQGAAYVLKTRTDLRMYAPDIQNFLLSLVEAFPYKAVYPQNKRIVGVSLNTFKYRPYSLSDMTLFGEIKDMLAFWSCPLDVRRNLPSSFPTMGDWVKARLCEVYLVTSYLSMLGRKVEWTVQDSWRIFADHFCIVDQQSLDLYWQKYNRTKEFRRLTYDCLRNDQELGFKDWLILYQGLEQNYSVSEMALDLPFKAKLPKQ